jgi:hypothetical protein
MHFSIFANRFLRIALKKYGGAFLRGGMIKSHIICLVVRNSAKK